MAVYFYETLARHSPRHRRGELSVCSSQLPAPSSQFPVWPFPQVTSLPVCWLDVWLVVRQLSDLYVLFNIIMAGRFAAGTRCPVDSVDSMDSIASMPQLLVPPVGCAKCEKLSTLQAAQSTSSSHIPRASCSALRVRVPVRVHVHVHVPSPCTCPVSPVHVHVPCPCGWQ